MTVISSSKDVATLTLTIVAEFDAPPSRVWGVWEDPRKLSRWWGPPTWPATFTRHDFTPGGESRYYMKGPDGEKAHGWWRTEALDKPNRIDFLNGLAGEDGEPIPGTEPMPTCALFEAADGGGTRMTVVTTFVNLKQMETMIEMGMREGLSAAVSQIDDVLVRGAVVADMSVSLDGFVADAKDGVDEVFAWYGKPQPEAPGTASPGGASAAEIADGEAEAIGVGVIVYGRRTFELANGWNGTHPTGAPVIVVTHSVPDGWPRDGSTVSFVTDGIEAAMRTATETAGGKVIALGSPSIIGQCLDLGFVDRIQVKLVPVLLGSGIRLFSELSKVPVELDNPVVTEGNGVTHLHYRVRS
ncbi:MAG TPA: SRPBCC domain-containing protein [Trebonia sp.]